MCNIFENTIKRNYAYSYFDSLARTNQLDPTLFSVLIVESANHSEENQAPLLQLLKSDAFEFDSGPHKKLYPILKPFCEANN